MNAPHSFAPLARSLLGLAVVATSLFAFGGQALADEHVNPDACLDMSQIDFWRGGQQYHWVEASGPTANGCPLWVAVPYR